MKTILALSFHPAFSPPKSGGEHRLYNIYLNLSKYFNVCLITFTYPNSQNRIEIVEHNEHFEEIRIPKTKLNVFLHYLIERFSNIKECSAIITSIDSRFNENFKKIINQKLQDVNTIIFVYPYLFTVPDGLLKNKKIIYESHNVEYELMKRSLSDSIIGKILLKYVYYIEKSLLTKSNLIFVVSEEDKMKLAKLYNINKNKIYISPNGVNPDEYENIIKEKRENNRHPICLFIGSYHPPNIEAIENIFNFAIQLPDTYFIIAGSASQYYINNSNDLLEQSDLGSVHIFESKILSMVNGFYNLEYWDSLPTVWTKKQFKMVISEGISSIELKIFSPCAQKFEIKMNDEGTYFELNNNFNSIKLSNLDKKNQSISFICEKVFFDHKRTLGVAIQEIICYKDDKKVNCDIKQCFQQIFSLKNARNVFLLGQISEKEKLELYHSSDIALNPMLSGSGTNIKMLDYMAAGLPVITTQTGARGLEIENNISAIICDVSEFPEKIMMILNNKDIYNKLSNNGHAMVEEKFDWKKIAEDMSKILEEKLQ